MNPGGFTKVRCDLPRPSVARIVIDAGANNPMDVQLCGELCNALAFAHSTAAVRAVVIGHTGSWFCSGGEVPAVKTPDGKIIGPLGEALRLFTELGKPTIAAIDGKAQGTGLALALAADLALVSGAASFAVPEPRAGLWSFHVLPRLVALIGPRRAAEVVIRGEMLDAGRAVQLGLVNELVAGSAQDAALELAATLTGLNPAAGRLGLPALRKATTPDGSSLEALQTLLDTFLAAPETIEAMAAFQDRREPAWKPKA